MGRQSLRPQQIVGDGRPRPSFVLSDKSPLLCHTDGVSTVRTHVVLPEDLIGRSTNWSVRVAEAPSLLKLRERLCAVSVSWVSCGLTSLHGSEKIILTDNRRHFPMPELKLYTLP